MADALLNIDELVAPISADAPSGADLRADITAGTALRSLKEQRNRNRTAERRIDQGDEVEPPDWSAILEGASELLRTTSKDLEVASWTLESLVRLEGFAGLSAGFALLERLVTDFWDTIYPRPEDGDESYRTMPIANLNGVEQSEGTLIQPISRILLTQGRSVGPYARWHYKQVLALELRDPEAKARLIAEGSVSHEKLQQAASETDAGFFKSLHADITESIARFDALTNALTAKCGAKDAPPSSNIRSALAECLQIVTSLAGPKLTAAAASPAGGAKNGIAAGALNGASRMSNLIAPTLAAGDGAASAAPAIDREQIFETVLACAKAWQALEPQSLLPAMLERAVKWGRLPPDQLMRELITEDGALASVTRLTGVNYYSKEEAST